MSGEALPFCHLFADYFLQQATARLDLAIASRSHPLGGYAALQFRRMADHGEAAVSAALRHLHDSIAMLGALSAASTGAADFLGVADPLTDPGRGSAVGSFAVWVRRSGIPQLHADESIGGANQWRIKRVNAGC